MISVPCFRTTLVLATCVLSSFVGPSALAQDPATRPGSKAAPASGQEAAFAQQASALISKMTMEEKAAQMQDQAPALPRLQIPAYGWWNEGLHGVANSGYATNFPQAIGLASTWDPDLIHQVAEVISTEARAKHSEALRHDSHARFYGLTFWSPNINIFRDPRWGRGQETYGEDPFLTSRLGVSFVTGLQGDDPEHPRVISTPKHFAVHSGPESLRHQFDVPVSPHDLEDTYLPAFRATVTEGHAGSVMCAYNAIDGAPACASLLLLKTHLRDDWKFKGYVVSDCDAIHDIFVGHKFVPDGPAAAAAAVKAGTDLECGNTYRFLPEAVKRHLVTEAEVDRALSRLLMARLRLGMLQGEEQGRYAHIPFTEVNSSAHQALALRTAEESIVLLKNENHLLPLTRPGLKIAVVGPAAEYFASLQGNYSGTPLNPTFPLAAIQKQWGAANVSYAQGSAFVQGALLPISRSALKPTSSPGAEGLTAEYFNSNDFSGKPVLVRTDLSPNFNFTQASPGAGVAAKTFAVRWSATLTPPAAGDYRLGIHLGECYACKERVAYRFFLDGKLLLDSAQMHAGDSELANASVPVSFADLQPHKLLIEYTQRESGGQVDIVWEAPVLAQLSEAEKAARQADVVIAFVGLSTNLEGEEMNVKLPGFAGGDRTSVDLPAAQQRLLEAVAATGKPLVVVLMNGSALSVNWAQQHAAAILEAWYPGEQGGTAIANTVSGSNNPGGRLPVTFYKDVDQLPPFENYGMAGRTYRYFRGAPLYPFGFGMSYTTFTYGKVQLSQKVLNAEPKLTVKFQITNNGRREGDEVPQLYIASSPTTAAATDPAAPIRSLQAFTRIHLAAGQSRIISFDLGERQLSTVDSSGKRAVNPGAYEVFVGGGQPGTGAPGQSASFTIDRKTVLPE